jgi:hypothetical protein
MSDMITRVAKAICNRADDEFEPNRDFWIPYARAAIEAMREPSEEQIELLTMFIRRCVWGRENVIKQYRELIDAALSQDTHSLPLKPQEAVKPAVETPQAPAAGTNSDEAP